MNKFIRKQESFLIVENIKQAKLYLQKNDIDLNDPRIKSIFDTIVNKLNKFPNLIDSFTRMVFSKNPTEEILKFNNISTWVLNNKNLISKLPKNIQKYKSLEHLQDDIKHLEDNQKIHKFIKSLYNSMREEYERLNKEEKEKFNHLALSFMELDDSYKKQFTPLKYFKMNDINIKDFMISLARFVNHTDINDEKENVLDYISNNDKVNIVYNENNIIVIQSNDGDTVCDLGSQKWCIVYSPENYQKQYFGIGSGGTQYIIYNFNLPSSNPNSMFGVTIDYKGESKPGSSQNKLNHSVKLDDIYKITGIPNGILKSKYENDYKRYKELINEIISLDVENISQEIITEIITIKKILNISENNINVQQKLLSWFKEYVKSLNLSDIKDIKKLKEKVINLINHEILKTFNILKYFSIYESIIKPWYDKNKNNVNLIIEFITDFILGLEFNRADTKSNNLIIEDSKSIILETLFNNYDNIKNNIIKYNSIIKSINIGLRELIKDGFKSYQSVVINILYNMNISFSYRGYSYTKFTTKNLSNEYDNIVNNKEKIFNEIRKGYSDNNKEYKLDNNFITELYNGVIENIIEDIFDIDYYLEIDKLDELISNTYKFEDYIINSDFYDVNITTLVDTFEEISKFKYFLIDLHRKDIINIIDFINDPYETYDSNFNNYFLEYIGGILILLSENEEIDFEIDENLDSITYYSLYLSNSTYKDNFYKSIGMKKMKEGEDKGRYYNITNYEEIGSWFNNFISFENLDWYPYDSPTENYTEYLTDIRLDLLYDFLNYFKENGYELNLSPFDKYINNEKNYSKRYNKKEYFFISYEKTQEIYRSDKEISKLNDDFRDILDGTWHQDDIDDIIDNDIIEEIQRQIIYAYDEVDNDLRQSDYLKKNIENVGNSILETWKENGFYGDYLRWNDNKDNNGYDLIIIPDINSLTEDDNFVESIYEYSGNDFSIDDIISAYLDENGKFNNLEDGWVSWEKEQYEYFNERLDERMRDSTNDLDIKEYAIKESELELESEVIDESMILKYKDYITEKNLDELNNRERFISEFSSEKEAIEDLKWYTDKIENLNKNGGQLYRLVFLENLDDLNDNNLGDHWIIDKEQLSNFYNSLENDGLPYLITANIEPGQIDLNSYNSYEELPHELEVNLKYDPKNYKIDPYLDTFKSKSIWEKFI